MEPEAYALENLAFWLGVEPGRIHSLVTGEQLGELYAALVVQSILPYERSLRRLFQPLVERCPPGLRRGLTGLLKQVRNLKGRKPPALREGCAARLLLELREQLGVEGIDWGGARSAVCLTHDVDTLEGYRFIEKVMAMEERYEVRSSFNFLTGWEYRIDPELIAQLSSAGYEIGLHGLTHDIALGFREPREIRRQLAAALEGLPVRPQGFRAPALAGSRELFCALDELGFQYDSSLPVVSRYLRGAGTCFPYRYPGLALWEVPLAIQDDTLFRDLHLSEEEGFQRVKDLVEQVQILGGVAVINTHPCILRKYPGFYWKLLNYLRGQATIGCMPVGTLIQHLEAWRTAQNEN